ncbi:MAG: hypothetical protein ACOH2F_07050 [Cellulomonas sp.]
MHATTPSSRPRAMPGSNADLLGFGLAALVAIIGVTTAIVWCVTGILDQAQAPAAFVRAEVPGTVSLVLTQIGEHVIYYEGDDPTAMSASQVDVTAADGAAIEVRPYADDLRYDVPRQPGRVGTAIAVFDADRTGSYSIGTQTAVAEPGARLAVGDDLAPATVRAIVLPALLALLSVLAAVAGAVRTWTRRNRRSHP